MMLFTLLTHFKLQLSNYYMLYIQYMLFYNYGFLLHLTKVLIGMVDRW